MTSLVLEGLLWHLCLEYAIKDKRGTAVRVTLE